MLCMPRIVIFILVLLLPLQVASAGPWHVTYAHDQVLEQTEQAEQTPEYISLHYGEDGSMQYGGRDASFLHELDVDEHTELSAILSSNNLGLTSQGQLTPPFFAGATPSLIPNRILRPPRAL